jgi:hypothetical protein
MPGFRFIEVPADNDEPTLQGAMWYPCAEPAEEIDLGDITATFEITLSGSKECPISGDRLPLVVVSQAGAATSSCITTLLRRSPMPALSSPQSTIPATPTSI